MIPAVVSEVRKIITTRLWWILLIVVAAASLGFAALYGLISGLTADGKPAFTAPEAVTTVYNGGSSVARILVLVMGAVAMGNEYRHKTLATTYLGTPRRWKVLSAKAVSVLGYGVLGGVVAALAGVLMAIPFVVHYGGSMQLGAAATWRSLVLGVVSLALWALLGMGIGILIRSMVVSVLVAIGFSYLVEPILSTIFAVKGWDLPLNLMPTGATDALTGGASLLGVGADHPFSWWQGGLVLLGWAAIPTIIGMVFTVRRDVA